MIEQKENKPTQSKQKQVEKSVIKEPKQEEQKEMTAWEELGMTEDEYYNKPAWSWARVDFPVEKYGSEEACFNACIKYGEESEMGFSCSTINSASGRYLGEMIKLFYTHECLFILKKERKDKKMKNKRIMYALISILFLTIFFGITKVNAEEYKGQAIWPSEKIANIYIRKYREDGYIKYQQGAFIRRSEDNKFVYCLQPYVDIDNNLPYYKIARSDFAVYLNMTEEQWQRISLLAYYGYQYKENGYDHSAKKWYVITQVMIWRTAVPTSRIVFTDTLNGKDLPNKFASEIAEMEDLLNKHYTKPNFNIDGVKLPIGKSMDFTDTNGILNQFTISSVENGVASINGNTLTITSNSTENVKVKLIKKLSYWSSTPIVYYSNHSQNVMRVGNVDPIQKSIELESVGGKVEINKVDSETKNNIPQGNATLGGAKYGIYNLNNEKVGEITTDEN